MEWFEGMDSRDNSAMAVLANTERSRHEKPALGQNSYNPTMQHGAQNNRDLSRSKVLATERDINLAENATTHKFLISPMHKNHQRREQSSVSKVPNERNTEDFQTSIAHKAKKLTKISKFEIEDSVNTAPSYSELV